MLSFASCLDGGQLECPQKQILESRDKGNKKTQCLEHTDQVLLKSLTLYTSAESDPRGRVLSEVEKESFIALPDKGKHTGFCIEKLPFGIKSRSWKLDSCLQEMGGQKGLCACEPCRAPLDFTGRLGF